MLEREREREREKELGFDLKLFSNRLRSRLEEKGMEQKKLAQKINVATASMNNYVWGTSRPSLPIVCAIAKNLDMSVDYLIGLTDYPEIDKDKDKEQVKILLRDIQNIPEGDREIIKDLIESLKRKHHKRTIVLKREME